VNGEFSQSLVTRSGRSSKRSASVRDRRTRVLGLLPQSADNVANWTIACWHGYYWYISQRRHGHEKDERIRQCSLELAKNNYSKRRMFACLCARSILTCHAIDDHACFLPLPKLKLLLTQPEYHDFPPMLLAIHHSAKSTVRWLAITVHLLPLGLDYGYLLP